MTLFLRSFLSLLVSISLTFREQLFLYSRFCFIHYWRKKLLLNIWRNWLLVKIISLHIRSWQPLIPHLLTQSLSMTSYVCRTAKSDHRGFTIWPTAHLSNFQKKLIIIFTTCRSSINEVIILEGELLQ